MSTESVEENTIICPTCAGPLDYDHVLWVLLGKWYCSEKCVRVAMKRN